VMASFCPVCRTAECMQFSFCSKRCDWFARGCCPQCGRSKMPQYLFCSGQCAQESHHANWCAGCGVRQIAFGRAACNDSRCSSICSSADTRPSRAASPNTLVAQSDKIFSTFAHHCQGLRLHCVVKLGGSPSLKKRYSTYRSRVEEDLNVTLGRGAAKYGHGGEGNEQRRFIAFSGLCLDGSCGLDACGTCGILRYGVNFVFRTREARLNSAISPALEGACTETVALLVCRAVVGHPSFTGFAAGCHSIVEPHDSYDVVTLFEPTAVDLVYLITGTKEV